MGDVIELRSAPAEETIYTINGLAKCLACQHEWQGVAPAGTSSLECPECGISRGTFTEFISPLNQSIWVCACGGWLFAITGTAFICVSCARENNMDGTPISPSPPSAA